MTDQNPSHVSGPRVSGEAQAQNLLADIHVVSNRISRAFAAEVTTHFGLSIAEWRFIVSLKETQDLTARDIARRWGMEKMAANRAARRLEASGLVRGTEDRADRRRRTLRLTDRGDAEFRRIEPAATARYRDILRDLTAEERVTLSALLDKLVGNTEALENR